ncbi:UDP-N-acetylmuramate dehydrogenase [Candidatus Saccharibacteria bacterium]|nr:UDP-N-acetylmuramate dehydrogenase [Candidatus Saccharibacteria bacterium]
MDIHTNIPLKNYLTMKIGGNARFMTEVHSREELAAVCENAKSKNIPIFIIGGGSNVIARDEGYEGLVIRIRIPGFEIISEDDSSTTIRIGAGENWDSVVKRSVDMKLSGIEAMSGIPGTAGATPIQNVGAYGQEIADTLQSLEAYDLETKSFVTMQNSECGFSYRDSIFRSSSAGRYIITSITIVLSKYMPKPPFYDSLQRYLDEKQIKIFTPDIIRNTVLEIRKDKLPDPAVQPSAGSFFKNAIVDKWQAEQLKPSYPDMPMFEMADGRFKIPTGWLIEKTGLKGQLINGMRISPNNALVLINESAHSYDELAKARDEITIKIRDMFRIQIEQEPLEM